MAYQDNRFVRQTLANNAGQLTTTINPSAVSVLVNGPAFFTYASATDAQAVIAAANYFAPAVNDLAVNDLIFTRGSDAFAFYTVTAVDRVAKTITVTVLP